MLDLNEIIYRGNNTWLLRDWTGEYCELSINTSRNSKGLLVAHLRLNCHYESRLRRQSKIKVATLRCCAIPSDSCRIIAARPDTRILKKNVLLQENFSTTSCAAWNFHHVPNHLKAPVYDCYVEFGHFDQEIFSGEDSFILEVSLDLFFRRNTMQKILADFPAAIFDPVHLKVRLQN